MTDLPEPSRAEKALVLSTIESVLQLMPVVGGALGSAVGSVSRYQWECGVETALASLREQADPRQFVQAVRQDERLGIALAQAVQAASRTSLSAKRVAMGRALSDMCDAEDPRAVDDSEMLLQALAAIDIPHFRALKRIRAAADEGTDDQARRPSVHDAAWERVGTRPSGPASGRSPADGHRVGRRGEPYGFRPDIACRRRSRRR